MNRDPNSALGEHLVGFYWRGVIGLDEPVFTTYWANVAAEARGNVVETLGRWARDVDLTPEEIERLHRFWSFTKENVRTGERDAELAGFTWWFIAPGLPVGWRVEEGGVVQLEPGLWGKEDALRALGPDVRRAESPHGFGVGQMILRHGDAWIGGSDGRGDGFAAGF